MIISKKCFVLKSLAMDGTTQKEREENIPNGARCEKRERWENSYCQ